ncbi:hypothetical protein XENOCAPTIV_012478 [Xenoophorus captivus]|uniref:WWE domain-containing protein n=1 Tax=Xenoophorus captivus TaxID=1517983 RepID=A0ABV0QRG0_9TELE
MARPGSGLLVPMNRVGYPPQNLARVVVWEWLNEHGRWRPYSAAVCHHIENVLKGDARGSVILGQVDAQLSPYIIDLQSMHQFRQDTGKRCEIILFVGRDDLAVAFKESTDDISGKQDVHMGSAEGDPAVHGTALCHLNEFAVVNFMEYVWEQFRWFVGGSCEKDSSYVREKVQVACTPDVTVKSHLHQKKVKLSPEQSL